jgi:hypothetical protein
MEIARYIHINRGTSPYPTLALALAICRCAYRSRFRTVDCNGVGARVHDDFLTVLKSDDWHAIAKQRAVGGLYTVGVLAATYFHGKEVVEGYL